MKEIFTGKNKEQFEKWLMEAQCSSNRTFQNWMNEHQLIISNFYDCVPFEMQLGVILAYADSLGFEFEKSRYIDDIFKLTGEYEIGIYDYTLEVFLIFTTRSISLNKAYKEAFKKFNNIINKT